MKVNDFKLLCDLPEKYDYEILVQGNGDNLIVGKYDQYIIFFIIHEGKLKKVPLLEKKLMTDEKVYIDGIKLPTAQEIEAAVNYFDSTQVPDEAIKKQWDNKFHEGFDAGIEMVIYTLEGLDQLLAYTAQDIMEIIEAEVKLYRKIR